MFFAIAALLAGRLPRVGLLDPAMGIVGAICNRHDGAGALMAVRLAGVLLDKRRSCLQMKFATGLNNLREAKITDLHVWSVAHKPTLQFVSVSGGPTNKCGQHP